ncbi:MAG TPA: hypothetical protein VH107_07600 [Lacipirellulaceae bacterium]|nr:hypothetical protein [Lacipirellulaceae bacterium]
MLSLLAVVRHHHHDDPAVAWVAGIVFFGTIAFAIGTILYRKRLQRKRTAALPSIAASLGLEFQPLGSNDLLAKHSCFGLFSRGRLRKALNVLQGDGDNRQLAIFDYDYTTGHSEGKMQWHTTVLSIGLEEAALPYFFLRRKRINDTVYRWFRNKDIEIPGYPEFRRRYVLRGKDVAAICKLFTEPVMDFFYRNSNLSAEGRAQTLVLYRLGKRLKPSAVNDFLSTGLELVSLLKLS